MAPVISLRDFVGEMQLLSDDRHGYLNKVTGELITISDEDIAMAESNQAYELMEWQEQLDQDVKRVLASEDFLKIPSKFDIHEYEIMERYCLSIPDRKVRDVLLGKIKGSGAFRRFKDTIYRNGIERDWFKYRDDAYKEIAITWLASNGFAYTDDMNKQE